MQWLINRKHNRTDEEYEMCGFSLVKWENPNYWVLYKTHLDKSRQIVCECSI